MLNFPIQNVASIGREVYLFNRQQDGKLSIFKDKLFFPYFYEENSNGIFRTIDGKKVNKIFCREPSEVKRKRTDKSYEADILFSKRYVIDKVGEIIKSPTKYLFIDIEILTKELPSYLNPNNIITCISVYNSLSDSIQQWFINDFIKEEGIDKLEQQENELLKDFIKYIKDEQPDILLGWNFVDFDYPYLASRIKKLWSLDLARLISPINTMRYGRKIDEIPYPAGISILDYLDMFKKIYNRESSYALDSVAQKYLKVESIGKTDFNQISEEVKNKNLIDVQRLVAIEDKLKIIEYYDEIRRMSKAFWEDLTWYSKVLDVMLLTEARQKGIILPSKKYGEEFTDEVQFEGAYRRAELGRFENLYKLDLSSAYPMAIIKFCLDIANIINNTSEQKIDITDRETNEIKYSINIKQDTNALLPTLARKLIIKKDYLKKQLKTLNPETEEARDLQIKYDATKSLVNSLFGVTALKVFRLYDIRIASAITSIVRELLHYVEDKLIEKGMKVTYIDTDSVFVEAKENPTILLNDLVKQWAKERYNKDDIEIEFDNEGIFEQLLVVALCHYKGRLMTKKGLKIEEKGIEAKRKDSSKFMKEFQTTLIDKILNNESQEAIIEFIASQKEAIKTAKLVDIGFPAKINNEKEYKSIPIFVRALDYSKKIFGFNKNAGDTFYWLYVDSLGEEKRNSKRNLKNKETGLKEEKKAETTIEKNVLAFDEDNQDFIKNINWEKMIEKTITDKCEKIFDALKWDISLVKEKKIKKSKVEEKEVIIKSQPTFTQTDFLEETNSQLNVLPKEDISQIEIKDTINIFNDSCLNILPRLKDDSVSLVFTSPPYNCGNKGKNKDMYTEYKDDLSDEEYYNLLSSVLKECLRVCNGLIFFNINYMNNNKKVLYKIVSDYSDYLRENIIWDKGTCQPPIGNILGKRYEYIFVFTKNKDFKINNFRVNLAANYKEIFGNWISNLIKIPKQEDDTKHAKIHRATFPIMLPKVFIDIYTKEGDNVLDPFMGLGSTLLAAKQLNRKGIGIELTSKYFNIAKEILEK